MIKKIWMCSFFLFPFCFYGRDILLISYDGAGKGNQANALYLADLLEQRFHIPKQLITVRKSRFSEDSIIKFQITEKGTLTIETNAKQYESKTFNIFGEGLGEGK